MKIKFSIPLISFALLSYNSVNAYQAVDLYQFSLEELLDIKVISASRKQEKQHLAPGVMSVVTAQDIEAFGARHLRDVIDRLVGTQVLGSHQDFHSKTSIRALNSSHHESSVLILLNGRPVRQATDGGLNSDLYIGFPLKSIERIEVIRGPGSVIYGSNAMSGVLNIITHDASSTINKDEAKITAGSFGTKQIELNSLNGNADYSINVSFNSISSDGDPVSNITDEDGNIGTYETGVRSQNLLLNARYKGFTVNGIAMQNHQDSANSSFQLPNNPIDLERYYLDVGYLHEFSQGWDISFNYTRGEDTAQWQINEGLANVAPLFSADNFSEGETQTYETILRGKIGEDFNLLFGASHTRNLSGFIRGLPQGSKNSNDSIFTQFDYMTSSTQKIIAGVQWNNPDSISPELSPRLGLIQGISNNLWLKLLYSEAYRSPNLVETDLDAPQLRGVPTLDPENISTYDAQLIYQTATRYFAVALYHSKLENLIVRIPGNPTTHGNEGSVEFNGIEIEGRMELDKSLSLTANLSFQENETQAGIENGTFAPQLMAKFGVNYNQNSTGLNYAIFNSYIGESTDLSETNIAPAINPDADAYNLLTANITLDTGKIWGIGKPRQSSLSLYLDNILNEDVFSPDLNFANQNNTIPHHWGMGSYLSFNYKF